MSKYTKLREGFSAFVNTTEEQVINTLTGPVMQKVQVFVPSGGELPDNMAEGEHDRLAGLGAFTPVPPISQRVQGVIANNPEVLHATAPEGEAVHTPSDIRADADPDDEDEDDEDDDEQPAAKPAKKTAGAKKAASKSSSVHGR